VCAAHRALLTLIIRLWCLHAMVCIRITSAADSSLCLVRPTYRFFFVWSPRLSHGSILAHVCSDEEKAKVMAAMEKELVSHGREKDDYTWLFKTKNKTQGQKTKSGNQYLQFWTVSEQTRPYHDSHRMPLSPHTTSWTARGRSNPPNSDSWRLGWHAQAVGAAFRDRTPDQIYQFAKKHCLHLNNAHTWTDDDRAELIACVALLPTLVPNPDP
jgi:hypothetical protein